MNVNNTDRLLKFLSLVLLCILSVFFLLTEENIRGLESQNSYGPSKSLLTLSLAADYAQLNHCIGTLTSMEARLTPIGVQNVTGLHCQDIALKIIGTSQTNAFAWLVLAISAHWLSDSDRLNSAISLSFKYAPTALWLGRLRVRFIFENKPILNQTNQIGFENDLALMFYSPKGIALLANLYGLNLQGNSQIFAILNQQNLARQQAFLAALRDKKSGSDQ